MQGSTIDITNNYKPLAAFFAAGGGEDGRAAQDITERSQLPVDFQQSTNSHWLLFVFIVMGYKGLVNY